MVLARLSGIATLAKPIDPAELVTTIGALVKLLTPEAPKDASERS